MIDQLMEALDARFQEFIHDNNGPELRRKMEAAAAEVLGRWLKDHPDQVPEHLQVRIRRIVIRPGQRVEADLVLPRHLVPPEMLPPLWYCWACEGHRYAESSECGSCGQEMRPDDDDTEGEEWKG